MQSYNVQTLVLALEIPLLEIAVGTMDYICAIPLNFKMK